MLTGTATALTGLAGAALVLMGARAFWAPHAAAGFGIPDTPTEDPSFRAWLGVKAVRDIVCGLLILVLVVGAEPHLLGWSVLVAAVIPVGDATLVLRSKGPRATAYGVHAATALVMALISLPLVTA